MVGQLRYLPAAIVIGTFLSVSFAVCVAWDAVFADWAMRSAWAPLLPGFSWLSLGTFLLGLAEAFAYGFWLALLIPVTRWVNYRFATPTAGFNEDRRHETRIFNKQPRDGGWS